LWKVGKIGEALKLAFVFECLVDRLCESKAKQDGKG
jgi:hypothetical protein